MTLTLEQEKELWRQGFGLVCGLDEVGRGAWAGPLVAAAVLLSAKTDYASIWSRQPSKAIVRDSKKLSPAQRKTAANWLQENFEWGIGAVSSQEIDQLGLGPANLLAMQRATKALTNQPDYYLVDGPLFGKYFSPSQSIISGDAKVWCIAAASIIAKVFRDEQLQKYGEEYPQYGFAQHVGYGTKQHQTALQKYGPSPWHRRSFAPVHNLAKA